MTVIPSVFGAVLDDSALHLPTYAQIIRYDENAFFGINAPTNRERACNQVWSRIDREMIARNLREAQTMIENEINYPFGTKYIEGEQIDLRPRMRTKWARIQSLGKRAVTDISLNIALDNSTDPATFAAVATSVTNAGEIHYYEHDTDNELFPDTETLASGLLTATFPRARLVRGDKQSNPEDGWIYDQYADWALTHIDIKRVYTDTSDVGVFVWPLGKQPCPTCTEDTEPACGYIQSSRGGVITMLPEASSSRCNCHGASVIRVNYAAGEPLDTYAQDAIVHLAHANMSVMPCAGCNAINLLWSNDRFVPQEITQDRASATFGVSEGAWRAYVYAEKHRHVRLSSI